MSDISNRAKLLSYISHVEIYSRFVGVDDLSSGKSEASRFLAAILLNRIAAPVVQCLSFEYTENFEA